MSIDWTKPIETLDGKPCRVLATDLKADQYTHAIRIDWGDSETIAAITSDGKMYASDTTPYVRNVPERVEIVEYRNVYRKADGTLRLGDFCHDSRDAAESCACGIAIARVRVTIPVEVGKFDE